MDERWLDAFSSLQKKQWVEFAKRLEAFFHAGGSLAQVLEPEAAGQRSERMRQAGIEPATLRSGGARSIP